MKNQEPSPLIKLIVLALALITPYSCATWVQENRISLAYPGLPEGWSAKTIVFISDTHINDLLPDDYFLSVTEKIERLSPDLILITGDFIDGDTSDLSRAMFHLANIAQIAPAYGVMGNHDNDAGPNLIQQKLSAAGIQLLDNQNLRLDWEGKDLVLAGLADLYTDNPDLEGALAGVEEEDFVILLSHSPEVFAWDEVRAKADLVLSGHSHGGQVTFFGLWAPLLPLIDRTYWRGLYQDAGSKLLITNGIGVYGMGLRVFADPGIEILKLKPTQ